MLKRRLIFTLLADQGRFVLSRNFKLQIVGDYDWLCEHYEFEALAFSVDELVILDVSRKSRDHSSFAGLVEKIASRCFVPITAGGGIRSLKDAQRLLRSGADKITVNSPLFEDPELVRELVSIFGAQCVTASIDYRIVEGGGTQVWTQNGGHPTGKDLAAGIRTATDLGAGELYLTSILKDGTGQGMDQAALEPFVKSLSLPVILSGGAGNFKHLANAIRGEGVSAVSTANLFNFMGDNLAEARKEILAHQIPLAEWSRPVSG